MGISRRKPFSLREKLNKLSTANYNSPQGGKAGLDAGDWKTQLQHGSRQRVVNRIVETLRRHIPFSAEEGLNEIRRIAARFEERIYTVASSQSDYLRRLSLKMLSLESNSPNARPYSLPPNSAGSSNRLPGTA